MTYALSCMAVGRWCPSLTHVDLLNCKTVTDAVVASLASGCSGLRTLGLYDTAVGDAGMIAVATHCPLLTSLDLQLCFSVTDVSVTALAQGCPCLCFVCLDGCGITDAAAVSLAHGCPMLQEVDLSSCWGIGDAAVIALAQKCKSLKRLGVDWCDSVSDVAVAALIQHCPTLTVLNVASVAVTDVSILAIDSGGLPSLVHLCVLESESDAVDEVGCSTFCLDQLVLSRPRLRLIRETC